MKFEEYLKRLPSKRRLSDVKLAILRKLWATDSHAFPKPWVSSAELLRITGQKYFDRRTRELRDQLGCRIETEYRQEFQGHAWRITSSEIAPPLDREYLGARQKEELFLSQANRCAVCGAEAVAGVRGLQADHKIPLSRGGGNDAGNWQGLCNVCNVGKRRACEGCLENCKECPWAFPERVGVATIVRLPNSLVDKLGRYAEEKRTTPEDVLREAAENYLMNRTK